MELNDREQYEVNKKVYRIVEYVKENFDKTELRRSNTGLLYFCWEDKFLKVFHDHLCIHSQSYIFYPFVYQGRIKNAQKHFNIMIRWYTDRQEKIDKEYSMKMLDSFMKDENLS